MHCRSTSNPLRARYQIRRLPKFRWNATGQQQLFIRGRRAARAAELEKQVAVPTDPSEVVVEILTAPCRVKVVDCQSSSSTTVKHGGPAWLHYWGTADTSVNHDRQPSALAPKANSTRNEMPLSPNHC